MNAPTERRGLAALLGPMASDCAPASGARVRPTNQAPGLASRDPARHHHIADAAYWLLRAGGFACVNVLLVLGTIFLLFVVLGNVTPLGFFTQVENLAHHYLIADEVRRAQFGEICLTSFGILFLIVSVMRAPARLFSATSVAKAAPYVD